MNNACHTTTVLKKAVALKDTHCIYNFNDNVQELLIMSDILIDNIINMRDRTFEFIHVYSL